MTDFDRKLGQKIREIRISKGITQRELAGDKITRNMLSLIESGNASPSISTLSYLAKRLQTPTGYFFISTDEEEGLFNKFLKIEELKGLFASGDYSGCVALINSMPPSACDDEINYILAVSELHLSTVYAAEFNMRKAAERLAKADVLSSNSIYCGEQFSLAVEFYSELYRELCSAEISRVLCSTKVSGDYVPHEMIEYFCVLKLLYQGEESQINLPRGSYYEKHVTALELYMDGRVTEALKRLNNLAEDSALPYFMQFRVLTDLENAANVTGDVRIAYIASKRKLELIEKCKVN